MEHRRRAYPLTTGGANGLFERTSIVERETPRTEDSGAPSGVSAMFSRIHHSNPTDRQRPGRDDSSFFSETKAVCFSRMNPLAASRRFPGAGVTQLPGRARKCGAESGALFHILSIASRRN